MNERSYLALNTVANMMKNRRRKNKNKIGKGIERAAELRDGLIHSHGNKYKKSTKSVLRQRLIFRQRFSQLFRSKFVVLQFSFMQIKLKSVFPSPRGLV